MGLLSQGRPLDWDETKKYSKYIRERGIAQFINVYNESTNRADGPFKWGDEVEYILVKFDHRNKVARVSLRAEKVFQRVEELQKLNGGPVPSYWHPEFAAYMVEGTPGQPFGLDGNLLTSLCDVECSMRTRRLEVQQVLEPDETVMSITNFPRLGCPNFTHPIYEPKPETSASGSVFYPDEAIFGGHPRFKTLVRNIRARRRRKVIINVPIFRDTNTKDPFIEQFNDYEACKASKPNNVYMDAMGFGMGCCCLQITFQATHLEEAKVLYDQLAPIAPIALALGAACPIFRGKLTERDSRWNVIASSADDRTREESGETAELKESMFRLAKSRYDSISAYISRQGQKFNDLPLVFDQNYYDTMIANQVDPAVARHIAHLFIREPISVFKEKLEQTDSEMDHFENIQSTNWQTVRFKPPPYAHSPIGWRVEFRPLDAQTSDFENAAYTVFITLLTRVILAYKLNFLLPLSLVDENMQEAQKRDSIKDSRFWFRRNIMQKSSSKEPLSTVLENCFVTKNSTSNACNQPNLFRHMNHHHSHDHDVDTTTLNYNNNNQTSTNNKSALHDVESYASRMTINEIINGCQGFIGLIPIICHYVESFNDGSNTELINKINKYLRLISDRASLQVKTTARYMRDFVASHPAYRQDSEVNDEVAYDLMLMMDKIGKDQLRPVELFGQATDQATSSSNQINGWSSNFCVDCCMRQQRDPMNSRRQSPIANRVSNSSSPTATSIIMDHAARKSSSLSNGFQTLSRKSPSSRTNNKQLAQQAGADKTTTTSDSYTNSRSSSR